MVKASFFISASCESRRVRPSDVHSILLYYWGECFELFVVDEKNSLYQVVVTSLQSRLEIIRSNLTLTRDGIKLELRHAKDKELMRIGSELGKKNEKSKSKQSKPKQEKSQPQQDKSKPDKSEQDKPKQTLPKQDNPEQEESKPERSAQDKPEESTFVSSSELQKILADHEKRMRDEFAQHEERIKKVVEKSLTDFTNNKLRDVISEVVKQLTPKIEESFVSAFRGTLVPNFNDSMRTLGDVVSASIASGIDDSMKSFSDSMKSQIQGVSSGVKVNVSRTVSSSVNDSVKKEFSVVSRQLQQQFEQYKQQLRQEQQRLLVQQQAQQEQQKSPMQLQDKPKLVVQQQQELEKVQQEQRSQLPPNPSSQLFVFPQQIPQQFPQQAQYPQPMAYSAGLPPMMMPVAAPSLSSAYIQSAPMAPGGLMPAYYQSPSMVHFAMPSPMQYPAAAFMPMPGSAPATPVDSRLSSVDMVTKQQ